MRCLAPATSTQTAARHRTGTDTTDTAECMDSDKHTTPLLEGQGLSHEPMIEGLPSGKGGSASAGSPLAGGVFVLTKTIVAAGMLGLPFAFASCGWFVGPLMLVFFGLSAVLALVLLSESADRVGRPATFNAVAERAVPGAGIVFDAAIAAKCFGVATSYLIVIGDSAPHAALAFGASGAWTDRRLWTLVALCVAGPLAFMRRITALRHTSLLGLCCVLAITAMAVAFALEPNEHFDPCREEKGEHAGESLPCRGATAVATSPTQILRAMPLFVFSYTCQQNIFSVTNELAQPTRRRCASLCAIAVSIAFVVYVVLGSAGYATYGELVQHDVLSSYPATSRVVAVARVLISMVVTVSYPLQAHPSRACITTIANRLHGPGLDDHALYLAITSVFVAASGTLAFVVSDLGLVLSVVGATGSTIVSYILPGAVYYALFPERESRWIGLALFASGLVIMPVSLALIFWV